MRIVIDNYKQQMDPALLILEKCRSMAGLGLGAAIHHTLCHYYSPKLAGGIVEWLVEQVQESRRRFCFVNEDPHGLNVGLWLFWDPFKQIWSVNYQRLQAK